MGRINTILFLNAKIVIIKKNRQIQSILKNRYSTKITT